MEHSFTDHLLNLMDRVPFFIVKITRDGKCGTKEQFVQTAICIFVITSRLADVISIEIKSIYSFVFFMECLSAAQVAGCCLWYIWVKDTKDKISLQHFLAFDIRTESNPPPRYTIIAGWAIMYTFLWGACIFYTLIFWGISLHAWSFCGLWLVIFGFPGQVLLLKVVLGQRVRAITNRLQGGSLLGEVPFIRMLLDINQQINAFYSPIMTFFFIFVSGIVMSLLSWTWHSVHYYNDNIVARNLIASHVSVIITFNLLPLFMALACFAVCDETRKLEWEIMRAVSVTTPSNRKELIVLIQELHFSHMDFTCMDLFTVEPSSVTAFFGLMLSCLMVFIQFMKE